MKFKATVSLFLILLIIIVLFKNNDRASSFNDITYLHEIYQVLQNEDYFTAKMEGDYLILKNKEFDVTKKIKFESSSRKIKFKFITKEHDQVYFILNGSVDDTRGIVFTDSSDVNMDGLHKLFRIGGNTYYYETN